MYFSTDDLDVCSLEFNSAGTDYLYVQIICTIYL